MSRLAGKELIVIKMCTRQTVLGNIDGEFSFFLVDN